MVIALDKHKKPLGFVTERRARKLLNDRRAVVFKRFPFTIRIKDVEVGPVGQVLKDNQQQKQLHKAILSYRIKIDPGSKYTGMAIVENETNKVVMFIQLHHRGDAVKTALSTRNLIRRNRRYREVRYRRPKYGNKYYKKNSKFRANSSRPDNWLPPSIKSVADNTINWIIKLKRYVNLTCFSLEDVRFDFQLLNDLDITAIEYSHNTVFGYELREYLLEKYNHVCQYCGGESGDNILEWEHIVSRRNGGSDSIRNAALSCSKCNQAKGADNLNVWYNKLISKPNKTKLDRERIEHIGRFLNDKPIVRKNYGTWMKQYRHYLKSEIFKLLPDGELASGGTTKFNRTKLHLPKDHHYDALCVGVVPECGYKNIDLPYLIIEAKGRGTRLRGNTNQCGIIITKYHNRLKTYNGFMSGDIVFADIPRGKYKGQYVGRIAIRQTGTFNLKPFNGTKSFDVNHQYCKLLQKADGYSYRYEYKQK